MYQALYRKWRPKTFDEVVGQEHITQTLKNQISTGRLSHAYLFIGTRGTGKTTCAKILAKAVNCENPQNGNPCGRCPACLGIDDGSVMDVVELDAASNNGVDNVRALRDEAIFSPASVKKRVYIIDEVHMLSVAAFNALLKILEEPPEHLMFILATTELNKVPATILSRCQRHSFKRLDVQVITEHLSHVASAEGMNLDPEAAELIARLAEGGMRDALSLLDQCSGSQHISVDAVYSAMGLAGNRGTAQLLDHICAHDTQAALGLFQSLWQDGRDPAAMLSELSSLLRDVLMTMVAPRGGKALLSAGYGAETLKSFAKKLTTAEITAQMTAIQSSITMMKTAGNPKSLAELCLISMCEPELLDGMPELRSRVARLEKALEDGVSITPAEAPAPPAQKKELEKPIAPEPAPPPQREEPAPAPPPENDLPPWEEEPPPPRFERDDEPPEQDDIDPEQFAEFQPEDVFLDRGDKTATEPMGDADWQKIAARAETLLPPGLRFYLSDPKEIIGRLEGDSLRIYVNPGFTFGMFSTQSAMLTMRQAAADVTGRAINVTIAEMDGSEKSVARDIEELRKFKEVHFLGGQ